jgi:hypothetical protein
MDAERLQHLLATPTRAKMVGWFDAQVLARSALLVTLANLFGRHSDRRLIEALATQSQNAFNYSAETGDFWLDYVSDIGDGFNSTYSVAHAIAQPELEVRTPSGGAERTHAGKVLIFGGDEVYPYPSREAYEQRTEKPYALAFAGRISVPDLFAVPGNHDWYDSLIAFSRAFCRPERGFAGCRTQQTRSYFALRLPARWWLLAIDLQLGADLDEPQVQYFQRVAEAMEPDARVILCVPEPQWIFEQNYPKDTHYEGYPLQFLQEKILKRPVQVYLTGDLHHYRRHENAEGVQKITSGGGGAFLHPTHVPRTRTLHGGFKECAAYPERRISKRLAWRNALFPFLNPKFFWMPAILYALSAWFASATLDVDDVSSMRSALAASTNAALRDPVDGLWLIAFIAAFVFFTDTHAKWYRVLGGVTHALSHLIAAFAIGWLALLITTDGLGLTFGTSTQLLISGAITFLVGGFVGSLVMGLYLLISLQVFRRHSEQAFSGLRIEDYKNWLRLKIDAEGALTIFAIGIDRVVRKWKFGKQGGVDTLMPDDNRATPPRLVDAVRIP